MSDCRVTLNFVIFNNPLRTELIQVDNLDFLDVRG